MTTQISVSRALSKSKTMSESTLSGVDVKFGYIDVNSKTLDGSKVKDAKDLIDKSYQSITDKINEVFRLRKGINAVNANTTITIDGIGEMSILDALSYKVYIIPMKRDLLNKLVQDRSSLVIEYRKTKATYDTELTALESRAGKEDMVALIEHKKKHEPKIVVLENEIEALRKEIDFFETEFDAVMSELNPTLKFDV